MIDNTDWRLNQNNEFLINLKLKKIKFPEFWQNSYKEKNSFYQKISEDAEKYVAASNRGREFLEGEKIQAFWHEHCIFCWEKFMTDMNTECFCTLDYYFWICKTCYEDFKEKFNFTLTD